MKTLSSHGHRQMGGLLACLLLVTFLPSLPAQNQPPTKVKLTEPELSQLLSPIALYPDALIALILPASTVPSDVVMGARYVAGNGDLSLVDNQPWDDSVKSLTRYPEVLSWMDQNLDWTASVGEAFMDQPADVMNAVQALRAQARAAGSLVDTPEQKVVVEEEYIRIIPADPEIIYVPQYDPQVVYVQSYSPAIITFGVGFAVGSWLNYDFDWRERCVYRGNWRGWNNGWRGGGGNRVNVVNIDVNTVTPWRPNNNSVRQLNQRQRNNNGNARIVQARAEQPQANVASRATFDPNRVTAVPRPSRLDNSRNDSRLNRPQQQQVNRGSDMPPTRVNDSVTSSRPEGNRSPQTRPNVVTKPITAPPVTGQLVMPEGQKPPRGMQSQPPQSRQVPQQVPQVQQPRQVPQQRQERPVQQAPQVQQPQQAPRERPQMPQQRPQGQRERPQPQQQRPPQEVRQQPQSRPQVQPQVQPQPQPQNRPQMQQNRGGGDGGGPRGGAGGDRQGKGRGQ